MVKERIIQDVLGLSEQRNNVNRETAPTAFWCDSSGDAGSFNELAPHTVANLKAIMPKGIDEQLFLKDCEKVVLEARAKNDVFLTPKSSKENLAALAQIETGCRKFFEGLAKLDPDIRDNFIARYDYLVCETTSKKYAVDGEDLVKVISCIEGAAQMQAEAMPKGLHRNKDRFLITQILFLWKKHIREPKSKNKKVVEFVRIMLNAVGIESEDPTSIVSSTLAKLS